MYETHGIYATRIPFPRLDDSRSKSRRIYDGLIDNFIPGGPCARPKASELLTENYRAFAQSITRYTRWSVALVSGPWESDASRLSRTPWRPGAEEHGRFQPQTINRAIRSSGIERDVSHYRLRWWRHRAMSNWPQLIRSTSFFFIAHFVFRASGSK